MKTAPSLKATLAAVARRDSRSCSVGSTPVVEGPTARPVSAHVVERGDNWVKCSELVTAYGYGKPPSAPEDHDAAKEVFQPLAQLTREQILAIARGEKPE